jgi:putative transposase
LIGLVEELAQEIGWQAACQALGVPRATLYRRLQAQPASPPVRRPRPTPKRSLSCQERQQALDLLHSPRFVDSSPAQIYATLLDEGRYLCSIRTFYRLLQSQHEVRERRNQLRHPSYQRPELLATAPNQVWSWDITKLRGPLKGCHYSLYVILDIYSRYVVGWLIAEGESKALAERLIRETITKYSIPAGQLTLHADRGSCMTSLTVAQLLADLNVAKSHSRPHTSDDNPFSEAQFKTLKYCPSFPDRFASLNEAKAFCRSFFSWYNNEHRHSSIALLAPADVHFDRAQQVLDQRAATLEAAYKAHPERFNRPPVPQALPEAVWINPPELPAREASLIPEDDLSQRA